jgi:predicted amidohydrolase
MKIAGVQMDVKIGRVSENLDKMIARLKETRAAGADLTVFPECALTGYCFDSLEEARQFAEPIPGPSVQAMVDACADFGGMAIFGMLEPEGENGVFNAAVMVTGTGLLGAYRKVHLPFLGVDQFSTFGDRPFDVVDGEDLKVGLNICYDSAFPESSRELTLLGADLIALPTNWPPGAEHVAEHAINTRAMENGVYYAAVNRVGHERGYDFIGQSRICGVAGETLAVANHRDEAILYADIDPAAARKKRVERIPGKHSIDRLADRRPEFYSRIVEAHELPKPGRE